MCLRDRSERKVYGQELGNQILWVSLERDQNLPGHCVLQGETSVGEAVEVLLTIWMPGRWQQDST